MKQLEKLNFQLSNPKELINYSCNLSSKLATVWASGDYYQKQSFQNVVFPNGLAYDAKIDNYRTPEVNTLIGCNAYWSKDLALNKKRTYQNLSDKSFLVAESGLEPLTFGL